MNAGTEARNEKFAESRGHVIEIWEEGASSGDNPGSTIFCPDMASIDGHRLMMPPGGIKIHEMNPADGDPILVTITLYARRVTIGAELDGPDGEPVPPILMACPECQGLLPPDMLPGHREGHNG